MPDTITIGTRTIPVLPSIADVREPGWHADTSAITESAGTRWPRTDPVLVRLYDTPNDEVNAVGDPVKWRGILQRDAGGNWEWKLQNNRFSTVAEGVAPGKHDISEVLGWAERGIDDKLRLIRIGHQQRAAAELAAQPHMEGLQFPASYPADPRRAKEWCDIGSAYGRGVVLSRDGMSGTLTVTPGSGGGWEWFVATTSYPLDFPEEILASGGCATLADALTAAERADADQHLASDAACPGDADLLAATIPRNAANRSAAQADHAWRAAIRAALAGGMSGSLVASRVGLTDKRVYQIRDNTR